MKFRPGHLLASFALLLVIGLWLRHSSAPPSIRIGVLHSLSGTMAASERLLVDAVRLAIVGFRPPDCRKVWAMSEKFLGETAGLWQYAVDLASEAMLVEDADVNTETPLTLVTYEENP